MYNVGMYEQWCMMQGYMSSAAVNVGGWCRLAGMEVLVTLHDENMRRMMIDDGDNGNDDCGLMTLPEL